MNDKELTMYQMLNINKKRLKKILAMPDSQLRFEVDTWLVQMDKMITEGPAAGFADDDASSTWEVVPPGGLPEK